MSKDEGTLRYLGLHGPCNIPPHPTVSTTYTDEHDILAADLLSESCKNNEWIT
jgi:hypothetical protein